MIQENTLSDIAHAIRVKRGLETSISPGSMPGEIMEIGYGIVPAGMKAISDNGIFDVTEYASVDVNVEQSSGSTGSVGVRLAGAMAGEKGMLAVTAALVQVSASMKQEV